MSEQYSEKIFQSIDEIISARLNEVSFDRTIECTILERSTEEPSKYWVTNGSIRFEAYANDESEYDIGDRVYVTITNGDYQQKKIIIGRYSADDLPKYLWTNPFERMVYEAKFPFIFEIDENDNSIIKPISITNTLSASPFGEEGKAQFDFIGLEIAFECWETDHNGEFIVTIDLKKDEDHSLYSLKLSSLNLYGNPYYLTPELKFYHLFPYPEGIKPEEIKNISIGINDNDKVDMTSAVTIQEATIYFGYNKELINTNNELIISLASGETNEIEENKPKNLEARWINKTDDKYNIYSQFNTPESNEYNLYWLHYRWGDRTNELSEAGAFWDELNIDGTGISSAAAYTYSFTPRFGYVNEKVKAVLAKVKEDKTKEIVATSNIIELVDSDGAQLNPDVLGAQDLEFTFEITPNHFVYDSSGSLDKGVKNEFKITAAFKNENLTLLPGNYVVWDAGGGIAGFKTNNGVITSIGQEFTGYKQLILTTDEENNIIEKPEEGVDYYIFDQNSNSYVKQEVQNFDPDTNYFISITQKDFLTQYYVLADSVTAGGYPITCNIYNKYEEELNPSDLKATGSVIINVGSYNNNGTGYKFNLTFEGDQYLTDSNTVIVKANLYNNDNQPVTINDKEITWSWYSIGELVTKDENNKDKYIRVQLIGQNDDTPLATFDENEPAKIETDSVKGNSIIELQRLSNAYEKVLIKDEENDSSWWEYKDYKYDDISNINNYHVLMATYNGSWETAEGAAATTNITAYLPIPIGNTSGYKLYGPTMITYSPQGTDPKYLNIPYTLEPITLTGDNFSIVTEGGKVELGPTLKDNTLRPRLALYSDNPSSCLKYSDEDNYYQHPIFIAYNTYMFDTINKWGGQFYTNAEENVLMAGFIVAGTKNLKDNTFTGVMMGDIASQDTNGSYEMRSGIIGQNKGIDMFRLGTDGSFFVGDQNTGNYISFNEQNISGNNQLVIKTNSMLIDSNKGIYFGNTETGEYKIAINKNGTATIGGWNIEKNALGFISSDETIKLYFGISNGATLENDKWKDSKGNYPEVALKLSNNFGVTTSGKLYASDVNLTGTINATRGQIGGLSIDSNGTLYTTNFSVTSSGYLTAKSGSFGSEVTIGGTNVNAGNLANLFEAAAGYDEDSESYQITHIKANSGTIGGFKIEKDRIYSGNYNIISFNSNGTPRLGAETLIISGRLFIPNEFGTGGTLSGDWYLDKAGSSILSNKHKIATLGDLPSGLTGWLEVAQTNGEYVLVNFSNGIVINAIRNGSYANKDYIA